MDKWAYKIILVSSWRQICIPSSVNSYYIVANTEMFSVQSQLQIYLPVFIKI